MKVLAVFDSKVGTYQRPFFMRTKGEAVRSWMTVVNDPNTEFYRHPEDFTLFELGDYDEQSGRITNHHTPESLGVAIEFKKEATQQ